MFEGAHPAVHSLWRTNKGSKLEGELYEHGEDETLVCGDNDL
jgi:hypothetical protein